MTEDQRKSPTDMCVDKTDCHYQDSRSKPSSDTTKDVYRKQNQITPNPDNSNS